MPAYYKKVAVEAAAAAWEPDDQEEIGFVCDNMTLNFVSGTGPVEISFDAKNVHGELNSSGEITTLELPGWQTREIWLRGVGDEEVQVFAWAT